MQHSRGAEEAVHVAAARAWDLGLDTGTAMAHGMRLFAILDFLRHHHDRLYQCGLLLPRDTAKDVISGHLLEVLAAFRSQRRQAKHQPAGDPTSASMLKPAVGRIGRRESLRSRPVPEWVCSPSAVPHQGLSSAEVRPRVPHRASRSPMPHR